MSSAWKKSSESMSHSQVVKGSSDATSESTGGGRGSSGKSSRKDVGDERVSNEADSSKAYSSIEDIKVLVPGWSAAE